MRTATMVTAAAAALMMTVCVFANGWYTAEEDLGSDWEDEPMVLSMGVGLTSVEGCRNDECRTRDFPSLSEVEEGETFIVFGWITTMVGCLAAILLLVAVLLVATRKAGARGGGFGAIGVCAAAMFCAIVFLSSAPEDLEEASVGWSAIVFLLSCGAGIVAGVMAVRGSWGWATGMANSIPTAYARAPVSPPGSQPVPACPQCSAPTEWVAQYGRHYCRQCSVYV